MIFKFTHKNFNVPQIVTSPKGALISFIPDSDVESRVEECITTYVG
jgi:hypothetical protein